MLNPVFSVLTSRREAQTRPHRDSRHALLTITEVSINLFSSHKTPVCCSTAGRKETEPLQIQMLLFVKHRQTCVSIQPHRTGILSSSPSNLLNQSLNHFSSPKCLRLKFCSCSRTSACSGHVPTCFLPRPTWQPMMMMPELAPAADFPSPSYFFALSCFKSNSAFPRSPPRSLIKEL